MSCWLGFLIVIQATQVQLMGRELRSCFRTTHCCHSENKRTNQIFFPSDTKHPIEIRSHGSKHGILPNIKDISKHYFHFFHFMVFTPFMEFCDFFMTLKLQKRFPYITLLKKVLIDLNFQSWWVLSMDLV